MNTRMMGITNDFFNVRADKDLHIIVVTLVDGVIPAKKWNQLRDNICNDTKISDEATVYFDHLIINGKVDRFSYVTVGDWRKLGFSGNNIKNCIPAAPLEVIDEANDWFYHYYETLNNGILCGKTLENIKQMIMKAHYIAEFKTLVKDIHTKFISLGMSNEEIDKWFKRVIYDVYHPKC